jgi:hypothetical protein
MSRMESLLAIAGIALVVVCAGMFGLRATKPQPLSARAVDAAAAQAKTQPFRSAVVELTFRSRSLHDGEEFLSATGHRTEYIDVTGGRRREDYERTVTAMRQLTSTEALTWIFEGSKLYAVTDKNNKRAGHVADLREGYDYTIWRDSAVEQLNLPARLPGVTVSEEMFLGRPCKVYSISKAPEVQRWWVWKGVTLRSESHWVIQTTVLDTSEEAVRIEEDVDLDASLFTPPTDVTFEPAQPTVAEQLNHHKSAPWVRMKPEVEMF